MLERDGLGGLTLRAVAREAGVSHAAPTHHFGDLTGLVSELAAIGFRQFNVAMAAAGAIDAPPLMKAMARAKAYVAYAQAHPGMYGLMFRTERLDMTRPSLHEAASASFAGLASAVGVSRQQQMSDEALSLEQAAAIARAWSLVHGFTTLLLDGRLNDILKRLPEGQHCRDPAGCHAALDRRPAAGTMISAVPPAPPRGRFADHLHFVLAAFEITREFVGGLAGEFVGVGVGLHVDIGDMADRAGRQPRHRQHRFCGRPAVLVRVGIVGDQPALDDRERLAVHRPPLDGVGGRIERTEPGSARPAPWRRPRGCGRPRRFRADRPR